MSFSWPPSGIDRATGTGGQPGTPSPSGSVVTQPFSFDLEESSSSPDIERAEQATIVHTFSANEDVALLILQGTGFGTMLEDSAGNQSRVLSARYTQDKGNTAKMVITAEGTNFDVPPDEFQVDTVELNPSIFRHPRYQPVTDYSPTTGPNAGQLLGPQLVASIIGSAQYSQLTSQNESLLTINSTLIPDADVLALAQELVDKYRQGVETFYMAGFRVQWSYYSFRPILMNPGGYLENPVDAGLPAYFYSDTGDDTGNNIFTYLAELIAPAFYPPDAVEPISWLRIADTQQYVRTWFKVTQTWLGGPFGQWDTDIYTPTEEPA